jgi:hypothetical protein
MEIKILERCGIFLVGYMETKHKFLWFRPYKEFECLYKGINTPAHFKTLEEAREFVKKIIKPDVYYEI